MAQTGRIGVALSSPSTDYWLGADIVSQSQSGNYSVVRVSNQAINRGSSGSYSDDYGTHVCSIDGIGSNTVGPGPLGSGYANGQVRWDVSKDHNIPHSADGTRGNVTLRQVVSGWHPTNEQAVAFGGFARIPKKPSAPGTPVASAVLPTSLTLTWTASTDNGGSALLGYLIHRWDNPEGTGTPTVYPVVNSLTRDITGLTPGKEYRWVIIAKNSSYAQFSDPSTAIVVRMLSGMWIRVSGVWKRAAPYVKVAGTWKAAGTWIRYLGSWKRGG